MKLNELHTHEWTIFLNGEMHIVANPSSQKMNRDPRPILERVHYSEIVIFSYMKLLSTLYQQTLINFSKQKNAKF